MSKRLLFGSVATLFFLSAAPAFAASTTYDGTLSHGVLSLAGSQETGRFTDFYNFTLAGQNSYNVGVSVSNISSPSLAIYTGTFSSNTPTTASGDPTATPYAMGTFMGSLGMSQTLFNGVLTGGSYFVEIAGTGTGSPDGYGGLLTVSAVPLPPALPMFGAALLGLIGYGLFRKNTKSPVQISLA